LRERDDGSIEEISVLDDGRRVAIYILTGLLGKRA
jgi:hypothetical protein